jgi:hypothetical protein
MPDLTICSRCRRPAPRALWDPDVPEDDPSWTDPDSIQWEGVLDDSGEPIAFICGGCMTEEDLIALAEDSLPPAEHEGEDDDRG